MIDARPRVLIVDDDVAIGRVLEDVLQPNYEAHAVTSGHAALDILKAQDNDIAIVLADQQMPDMTGLELLSELRRIKPTTVGVLITAHADLQDAMRAINSVRVLGFIAKPWDHDELLGVMHRALDAHVTLQQLSRPREHELKQLQSLVGSAPAPITAQRFGVLPLREAMPRQFEDMADAYGRILGDSLDQRNFKVDRKTSQALHDLADELGSLSAGPRDVIDLHVTALKQRMDQADREQAAALVEEGRLLVLELMGHVVTYYRSHTLGVRA
jgi:response regulator RpfG family c-di-GMP phosphodiesterase